MRQLADWGADCIKIELPNDSEVKEGIVSDRNSPDFQNLHRNKRSMTLNLKTEKGKEALVRARAGYDKRDPERRRKQKRDYGQLED